MSHRTPSHWLASEPRSRDGAAQVGRERVELHHVGPRGEVRVATVRDDELADADERPRVALEGGLIAADEVLGMCLEPRMVQGDVVRDEVEDQP